MHTRLANVPHPICSRSASATLRAANPITIDMVPTERCRRGASATSSTDQVPVPRLARMANAIESPNNAKPA